MSNATTTPRTHLTPKRERFVQEYLLDPCATQAARRAGYSAKTASQIGYELLLVKPVMDAISEGRREQRERLQLRADDVVRRMLELAVSCKYETTRVQALDLVAKHLGSEVFREVAWRIRNGLAEGMTFGEIFGGTAE